MRALRLLLIPALLMLATACSDDSSGSSAEDSPLAPAEESAEYDPQPYCNLTRQLEKAGQEAFSTLDRNATSADYEAAERSFVLDNADLLDELLAAAPPDLTGDVETLLAAMRQRGGLEDGGVTQRVANNADERIRAWEKNHC